ncbi:MAG: hypothetical protein ACJ8FS_01870 [Sphingomicrobium sp.]
MGESELIGIIRDVHAQYAVLFGQIITINFAMIVAIYYFLHRSPLLFRIAAFAFYAIGMLALIGLMLEQANYKDRALIALAALPPERRSPFAASILAFHQSWLSHATSFFLNTSLWVLFAVVAFLLFWWRGDPEGRAPMRS